MNWVCTLNNPNKEALREWVRALLSGEYRQGYGRLKTLQGAQEPEYCCLGVACEIFATRLELDTYVVNDVMFYDDRDDVLPMKVVEFLGVEDYNPNINGTDISDLNDELEWDFNKIAHALNEHYELGMDLT